MFRKELRHLGGNTLGLYLNGQQVGTADARRPVEATTALDELTYELLQQELTPTQYQLMSETYETAQAYADALEQATPATRRYLTSGMSQQQLHDVAAELAARRTSRGRPMTADEAYSRLYNELVAYDLTA